MAERRATNKYYPPDWDPSKGSVNAFVGQHPLRNRARKLNEGILIIRFELPFSIWCGGCDSLLATGLRFNAEKKKIGNYYSTPIWSFRMKCRSCGHWFEIHTNPKESTYDVVRGARKKVEPGDLDDVDGSGGDDDLADDIIDLASKHDGGRVGGLKRLEVVQYRKRKAEEAASRLSELQGLSDRQWKNPDASNASMRKVFREGRKVRERNKRESDEIQARTGISLPILPAENTDTIEAAAVEYGSRDEPADRKRVKSECVGRLLFGSRRKTADQTTSPVAKRSEHGSDLKARLALRQLSRSDPFATGSVGQFGKLQDLGIRQCGGSNNTAAATTSSNSLSELSTAYAGVSSSSEGE